MYFKVALFSLFAISLVGCSATTDPKPKVQEDNNSIEVVEEVTLQQSETKIVPLKQEKVKTKIVKDENGFKPEPFSLKSDEEDPELLGPQTTLKKPLSRNSK